MRSFKKNISKVVEIWTNMNKRSQIFLVKLKNKIKIT